MKIKMQKMTNKAENSSDSTRKSHKKPKLKEKIVKAKGMCSG
jgi:hypothetical protein